MPCGIYPGAGIRLPANALFFCSYYKVATCYAYIGPLVIFLFVVNAGVTRFNCPVAGVKAGAVKLVRPYQLVSNSPWHG